MFFKILSFVLLVIAVGLMLTDLIGLRFGADALFSDTSVDGMSSEFWWLNVLICLALIGSIVSYIVGWRQMRLRITAQ